MHILDQSWYYCEEQLCLNLNFLMQNRCCSTFKSDFRHFSFYCEEYIVRKVVKQATALKNKLILGFFVCLSFFKQIIRLSSITHGHKSIVDVDCRCMDIFRSSTRNSHSGAVSKNGVLFPFLGEISIFQENHQWLPMGKFIRS